METRIYDSMAKAYRTLAYALALVALVCYLLALAAEDRADEAAEADEPTPVRRARREDR